MLRIFRKKKEKLLAEENFNLYLIYAIGEFVLVVLGILIALQIDNWNGNRKTKLSEAKYLMALHEEFSNNLEELERVMKRNSRNAEYALELSKYTGKQEPELTEPEFDSLFFRAVMTEVQYRPGSGIVDEIINSGKLDIFSNDRIRYEIASWESIMQKVRFQEQEHAVTRTNLMNFCFRIMNARNALFNSYGDSFELTHSRFATVNKDLLQSVEFDNHLVSFFVTARILNQYHYADLDKKLKEFLSIIEKEISGDR